MKESKKNQLFNHFSTFILFLENKRTKTTKELLHNLLHHSSQEETMNLFKKNSPDMQ